MKEKISLIDLMDRNSKTKSNTKHPKCKGYKTQDYGWGSDYDCEYVTKIDCDECKYNGRGGRKNPEAKCNTL